jgi:hypothetical protein
MRGFVYRLGRRRAGSVLGALGVALSFALGLPSPALARPFHGPAHGSGVTPRPAAQGHPAQGHPAPGFTLRTPRKPSTSAHAAGHKIA